MRINRFVATASGISRRHADNLIAEGRIKVNGHLATTGQDVEPDQIVTLDSKELTLPETITIAINKPVGIVVSRLGQGAPTIYSLLPEQYASLKPIGRLDKDSSGLILMSNDGQLIQSLAHPSFNKQKVYELTLDRSLAGLDKQKVMNGVKLDDGISKLNILEYSNKHIMLSMEEGRNRQIRRTFKALGYEVMSLNRLAFGKYKLENLRPGQYRSL